MYILVHFSAPFPRMGVLPTFTPLKKAGVLSGFGGGQISVIPGTRCLPQGKLELKIGLRKYASFDGLSVVKTRSSKSVCGF